VSLTERGSAGAVIRWHALQERGTRDMTHVTVRFGVSATACDQRRRSDQLHWRARSWWFGCTVAEPGPERVGKSSRKELRDGCASGCPGQARARGSDWRRAPVMQWRLRSRATVRVRYVRGDGEDPIRSRLAGQQRTAGIQLGIVTVRGRPQRTAEDCAAGQRTTSRLTRDARRANHVPIGLLHPNAEARRQKADRVAAVARNYLRLD
jgi:hypothetical protein